ncbi:MAG: iron-containing alcohol dehydrogenase [Anaerolineales bacterium]|nr:iron-containing alcohol dehydrogenase [Anaerolineales bacterium]
MEAFNYYQPTEIRFGRGRIQEIGEMVSRFGKRCLLVTVLNTGFISLLLDSIQKRLEEAGVEAAHFDGVVPNPTTEIVTVGAKMAKDFRAEVILGVGGGSSMDTAKAIAVEATHPGTAWDYLYFKETQPTHKTLPVIAVTTTSGTGSQVTQVAVMTHTALKTKSAIFHPIIFPRVCIVDPDLMLSASAHLTASTGFDVFCHAFESYLHVNKSPYIDLMALEAIRLVTKFLPVAVNDGMNLEAREKLAWADTLAGLCITNAGVTLPHGIGMTIGGQCPQVMHGEALAVIYPEFTRFTFPYAQERFATVGRILNPQLINQSIEDAAAQSCEEIDRFIKSIGMWLSLDGLGMTREDIVAIADNSRVLPDYKNNPRIASRDEIFAMLSASFVR